VPPVAVVVPRRHAARRHRRGRKLIPT
jgi:hypothetical protein